MGEMQVSTRIGSALQGHSVMLTYSPAVAEVTGGCFSLILSAHFLPLNGWLLVAEGGCAFLGGGYTGPTSCLENPRNELTDADQK